MITVGEISHWEELINKVVNADCVDAMRKLPDNSIDLIIADPPYVLNNSKTGDYHRKKHLTKLTEGLREIENGFDVNKIFLEFQRVCKKFNLFCFCSNAQISKIMRWGEERGFYTTLLVWHKTNPPLFANNTWRGDCEYCVHIREKGATFQGDSELKRKIWSSATLTNQVHPTQKPLELVAKYIKIGSNEGDLILDPFLGSGTTARACKNLKRCFIGIESEEKYCKIAEKRLQQENLL